MEEFEKNKKEVEEILKDYLENGDKNFFPLEYEKDKWKENFEKNKSINAHKSI